MLWARTIVRLHRRLFPDVGEEAPQALRGLFDRTLKNDRVPAIVRQASHAGYLPAGVAVLVELISCVSAAISDEVFRVVLQQDLEFVSHCGETTRRQPRGMGFGSLKTRQDPHDLRELSLGVAEVPLPSSASSPPKVGSVTSAPCNGWDSSLSCWPFTVSPGESPTGPSVETGNSRRHG